MPQEDEHKNKLEQARTNDENNEEKQPAQKNTKPEKPKASLKKFSKNVASAVSLMSFVEVRDVFFMTAIMMAMLKDVIDTGLIGTLLTPLTFIMTVAAMLVCGSNNVFGKKKATTLLLGNLFEIIPGLNFLPIETLSTILIYVFILQERKDARAKQ